VNLATLIRAFFGRAIVPRPPCRLSDAEALAIATGVLGNRATLFVRGVRTTPAGIVWDIGTATVGSGSEVAIDDATGALLERRTWGIR
jgi:hypothetical protein